jgi:hypothetical protein
MTMMITNLALALFFGWMVVLTFVVFQLRGHYHRLTTRTRKQSIDDMLDALLKQGAEIKKDQDWLRQELTAAQSQMQGAVQKIGFVRFNAFGKAEGEQSFAIALLNERNDGIIINFIYIHDGIRIYAKPVKGGKGERHELTEEEQQAVKIAH